MVRWFKTEKKAVLMSNLGKEYELDPEAQNKIGRSHSEYIMVDDDLNVSRRNSVITYDKQMKTYYIEDVGSKHGTYVNETRVAEKKGLKRGDIIRIGKYTRFTFEIR